jgi:hypothetical protein
MSDQPNGMDVAPFRWVFASNAERTAAGQYFAQDIGKCAYQTNTNTIWLLTGVTPTWLFLGGTKAAPAAVSISGATASATYKMQGNGATWTITPQATGVVLAMVSGDVVVASTSGNFQGKLYFGTGTAPIDEAAVTGTQVSGNFAWISPTTASSRAPVALMGVVSGLTIGTAYWFDIALQSTGGFTGTLEGCSGNLVEI